MAYDKNKIFEQAKEMIVKHKLFFVEDIVAFLPISKPTFYDYFKPDSNGFNELRELLEVNRTTIKVSLRKKWYDSDNATLQMGLMKLIANPEEHRRLSQTHQEHSGEIKTVNLTDEEVKKINNNLEQSY